MGNRITQKETNQKNQNQKQTQQTQTNHPQTHPKNQQTHPKTEIKKHGSRTISIRLACPLSHPLCRIHNLYHTRPLLHLLVSGRHRNGQHRPHPSRRLPESPLGNLPDPLPPRPNHMGRSNGDGILPQPRQNLPRLAHHTLSPHRHPLIVHHN